MFEITYNDSDTLQNFIDADKAYHGAIYDFTFEGRFIVYHFFVKDTARYVALDSMTGYGSEITRRRKDNLFDTPFADEHAQRTDASGQSRIHDAECPGPAC